MKDRRKKPEQKRSKYGTKRPTRNESFNPSYRTLGNYHTRGDDVNDNSMDPIDRLMSAAINGKAAERFWSNAARTFTTCDVHTPRRELAVWNEGGWYELATEDADGCRCDVCGASFRAPRVA